ncbi:MAG: peptidylprolyl isomerase [Rhodobacteraceae bacterium]|jgi:peptidyl-prolyl cis-trans isomerase C|nr:peptidylprolyl isomerase [Paracoccaceae bacterium]
MIKNASFAAATAIFAVFAAPTLAQDASTVVARVGDAEITLGHAIAMRGQLPQQFAQVPDTTLFPALIQQLIEQELLSQATADQLSRAETLMLENENRNFVANAALVRVAEAAVTEDSIAAAYQAYAEAFAQGDAVTEYHAAHILVREEAERDAVVAALAEGQDFADVARENSIDGTAQNGGDLGWFAAGMMIPDFQAAVEALDPGQVSAPVQTRFGWHVIKLFETRDAAVPPLDEVRDELVTQIQREASRALIASLREASTIEDLSEGLDPSLLSQRDLLDE